MRCPFFKVLDIKPLIPLFIKKYDNSLTNNQNEQKVNNKPRRIKIFASFLKINTDCYTGLIWPCDSSFFSCCFGLYASTKIFVDPTRTVFVLFSICENLWKKLCFTELKNNEPVQQVLKQVVNLSCWLIIALRHLALGALLCCYCKSFR